MLRSQRRRRRIKRPSIINSLKRKAGKTGQIIDLTRLFPIPPPRAPQSSNTLDMLTLRRAQPEVSARKRRRFLNLVNRKEIYGLGPQTFSELELQTQADEMRNQERRRELDKITRQSDKAIAANKARLKKLDDEEKISIKAIKSLKSLNNRLRASLTRTSRHKKSKSELPPAYTPSETVSESVSPQSVSPQNVSSQNVSSLSDLPLNVSPLNVSPLNVLPLQVELSPKTMKRLKRLRRIEGRNIRRMGNQNRSTVGRMGNQNRSTVGGKKSRKRRK